MNFNKRKIIFICSIVVSVFFVLLFIGKDFLFPIPPYVKFDTPTGICYGEDASIISDQANERLLFLDSEHKLKRIVKFSDATEINRVALIADDGKHFYIAGYKFKKNIDIISAFKVIRMDHDGKNSTVILEYANKNDKEINYISDINVHEGCLYIVRNDLETEKIIVTKYQIANGISEDILTTQILEYYIAKYSPETGILYVNDYYGRTFKVSAEQQEPEQILDDYIVENYIPTQDGGLLWIDSINKNLYKDEQLLLENTGAYYIFALCEDGVVFDNVTDNRLSTFDFETGNITNSYGVDFSATYIFLTVVYLICILYLGVLLIILIVRAIRNMYLAKNYVSIKRTGIGIILIISIFIIALSYTNKIIEIENQHLLEEIRLQSHYFAESIDQQLLDSAVYTPDIGKDSNKWQNYISAYDKLENKYGFFRKRMDENTKNGHLSFYKKLGDKLTLVYESDEITHIGYQYYYADFESLIKSDEIVRFTKDGYNNYHGMTPILNDNGEIIGVVEYSKDYRLTNENIKAICINMIVKLLSIVLMIFIGLIEVTEFFKNRLKRKELINQGIHPHMEITMVRNVSFLFYSIYFIDSVVVIFVTKKILETSGIQETAFLLALPSLMMGIGVVVSFFVFNLIASRVYVKHIAWICGIATLVTRLGFCVAVFLGNFVFFCLMKLIDALTLPYLLCIIETMCVKANDERERYYSSRQFSLGRISGFMMGVLISGFAIQDISQSAIMYGISELFLILLVLLLNRILPKDTYYVVYSREQNTMRSREGLAFLLDKSIIVYILFLTIPLYLIMGYHGYLFPMYSDTVQMPAIYVTTAVVMSRALLLILADSIERMMKKIDYWKIAVFGIGFIGIAFMGFAINSSIIWAMFMLVITGAAETVIMPAKQVVWNRQARDKRISLDSASACMEIAHEIVCAFKETMMSVFLVLGSNIACVALGAFCLIFIMIFMLYTRNKAMALPEKSIKRGNNLEKEKNVMV